MSASQVVSPYITQTTSLCYICRIHSILESTAQCESCTRSYHSGCFLSRLSSTDPRCSVCIQTCCRCWKPLSMPTLPCPRCQVIYHTHCEVAMSLHPGRQLCSLCIKELSQSPHELVKKYGNKDISGHLHYLVQFRSVSILHLSYVPERLCAAVPISEE